MKRTSLLTLAGSVLMLAIPLPSFAQPPIADLPAILHLQLEQRPAWRAYKDAAAAQAAEAERQENEVGALNDLATPARLDALRSRLKAQNRMFEAQAEATDTFYAVLSPEQKRIFDDVTRIPAPGSYSNPSGGRERSRLQAPPTGRADLPPPV